MRATEFLLEYDRNKTAQSLGAAIHKKMLSDRTVQRIYGDDPIQQINPEELLGFALDRFQEADPTPNKQYVQWIARTYANDASTKLEDVLDGYLYQYLTKFYKLVQRKKIPSPRNDINKYNNFGDFMSVLDEYPDPEKEQLKDKGTSFTLYDDENWRVIVPQDEPASCYYGQGTRWCTAATKGNNMFEYYESIAPLLIAIPKHPEHPGEKYQLHFGISIDDQPVKSDSDALDYASQSSDYAGYDWSDYLSSDDVDIDFEYGQIMDERDDPVSLSAIQNRMDTSWDGMLDAYTNKFPDRKWQLYMNLDHSAENDY
jgi:hypothetical protein